MASRKADSTLTPRADAARARRGRELIEYDEFIEVQIEKTRRQVKGVEVLGAVLFWLAGAILYLLLVVLIDHWLVGGGLGFAGRMLALLGFLAGTGAWLYWVLLPPLVGRVNPVYAAQTIEQHEPSLKNSLINFLLLRGERTSVAPVVFAAIEQRAAADLSHVPVDTVVDRGRVIRLGYVLMVVVAMFALYVLLSPKDPLRSVRRMLAPWSNLTAPTRVTIDDVQPGSIKAFHHDVIEVSAMVQGVREDETVTLYYSTADGQTVDRPIRMELPTGSYRYRASLPESAAGLLQSLSYYVAAGDVRTPIFEIEVLTAPAILVEAVSYEFPAYTGFGTRRIERVGDIAGIEGTQITIEAKANREIDAAYLDFDCNGTRDLKLSVSGRTARTTFELKRDSEGKPEYGSYQLIFVDDAGRQNPQPIRHRIEVTSDQAPLVEIVLPQSDELEVPLNGAVTIGVRAIDPDFALRSVTLFAVRGNDELVREPLLNERHAGEFRGSWLMDVVKLRPLEPGKPALAAGETIHYWAEARDVRQPLANRSETVRFRLKLISPGGEAEREEQLAQAEQEQEEFAQDRSRADEEGGDEGPLEDRLAAREQTRDQAEESASTDESAESAEGSRVDPEQNAGQAFEEVLKHRQQQAERRQQESPKPSESKSPEEQSPRSSEEEQAPQPEAGEEQRPVEEQPGGGGEGASGQPEDSSAQGEQQGAAVEGEPGMEGAGGESSPDAAGGQQSETGSGASEQGESGEDSNGSSEDSTAESDVAPSVAQNQESPGGASRQHSDGAREDEAGQGERGSSGQEAASEARSNDGAGQEQETPSEREGRGAQARQTGALEEKEVAEQADGGEPSNQSGGEPEDVKGESGAGRRQGSDAGSPAPQERNQPRDKPTQRPEASDEPTGEDTAPGSPSVSPKESDSEGGEEGDRSGGGEDGGGQKADQQGTGGAGQNTASDEGSGAAQGSGDGADSSEAGSKTTADRSTGQQGEGDTGQGGTGQAEQGDSSAGGAEGEGPGRPGKEGSPGKSGQGSNSESGGIQGQSVGGGQPGDESQSPARAGTSEPRGEQANLDYAREATDLALEHLKDQLAQEEPDPELLERLQWTREDMERFVARWEQMRKAAQSSGREGEEARQRLDDSLRELGLRRTGTTLRGGSVSPDDARRLMESRRSSPPSEYADQFKAYTEGMSKGRASGSR